MSEVAVGLWGLKRSSCRTKLTSEGSFVLDVDVLVLTVPLDGFLQTFEALHEGRYCRWVTWYKRVNSSTDLRRGESAEWVEVSED